MWLTFKHKRTSVESGGWSGAQQASCGHNRPPASQITDRWGMQGEKKKHLQLVLGENVFLIFSVKWWWQEPAWLLIWYRWARSVMGGQSATHLACFRALVSSRFRDEITLQRPKLWTLQDLKFQHCFEQLLCIWQGWERSRTIFHFGRFEHKRGSWVSNYVSEHM